MKMQHHVALTLSAFLAFASGSRILAAPSLDITEPPVSSGDKDGPDIDPYSTAGQWFTNLTSGAVESRSHEFHDNKFGFGGGGADSLAIAGVAKSIVLDGSGSFGTDSILSFEIEATIINDNDLTEGTPADGSNAHFEYRSVIGEYHGPLVDTKLTAEFAVADISMLPSGSPTYSDPYPGVYIVADNEDQWAWYCWNKDALEFSEPGAFQVPTWDFGDIPTGGGSATRILKFSIPGGLPPSDPRYYVILTSAVEGADILANRSTSLKVSNWVDALGYDDGSAYPESTATSSDVSVFHNISEPGADWGDAPDSPVTPGYPTLAVNGGANHTMLDTNAAWLGHFWDAETNGIPSFLAVGDDFDAENDEDGIVFTSSIIPGSPATLDVINVTSTGSYLQGWIDFNGDLDWADPGEQIIADLAMPMGPTSLVFSVPAGIGGGVTYARFRLSTATGLSYDGTAPDGEVEDYRVIIDDNETKYDFGDAPDPLYPTYIGSGGAGHIVPGSPTVYLGPSVDPEFNGQPDPAATGDDTGGTDDEDGVVFTSDIIAGSSSTVDVLGGPSGGLLDAWIDFNGDGDWFDAGEQIFVSLALTPGPNTGISYSVPEPLELGPSFARFRLSSAGGLSPLGMAPDGEVEDYEVTLYQPIPSPALEITNLSFTVSNTLANIEWNAQTNILYQLQATTNLLVSNSWVDIESPVLGPVHLQTNAVTTSQRFYRVTAPWAK
ncbi:GEVED domain-containing protein [Pontiella sp.]|uniref:GEVED domain-containing protein n=1 Tax=Pontiella sp. TaxID=2837462 RepID=UPI00356808F9